MLTAVCIPVAQGAVSLIDGQMDINLHRFSTMDDMQGLGEELHDVQAAAGTHIISFDMPGDSSAGGVMNSRRHFEQVGLCCDMSHPQFYHTVNTTSVTCARYCGMPCAGLYTFTSHTLRHCCCWHMSCEVCWLCQCDVLYSSIAQPMRASWRAIMLTWLAHFFLILEAQ